MYRIIDTSQFTNWARGQDLLLSQQWDNSLGVRVGNQLIDGAKRHGCLSLAIGE